MGATKRWMEQQEEQFQLATQIAVKAGILKRCEFHGIVYDPLGGDDLTDAYKLGNALFTAGELGDTFSTRTEMTDAVKRAFGDAAMDCYDCERMRAD